MSNQHPLNPNIFNIQTYTPANPAAGADLSWPVPANIRVQIIGFQCTFTTDANVASRLMTLAGYTGAAHFWDTTASAVQVLSLVNNYSAAPGLSLVHVGAIGSSYNFALPNEMILHPTESLVTRILAIQATDQISDIAIRAKVWAITS